MTIRRRVIARGRVRGVFFRDSVRRAAQSRSVAGYARNLGDGTVEAVFEGDAAAVEAMIDVVRRGPGHAQVTGMDVSEEEPEGLQGFDIR